MKPRFLGTRSLAIFVFGLGVAAQLPGARAQDLPAWKPDPGQAERLDQEVNQPGFRLRPPKGYQLSRARQGAGEGFAWVGPIRPDGSRPMLMVVVYAAPAGETNRYTPEQALEKFLAA